MAEMKSFGPFCSTWRLSTRAKYDVEDSQSKTADDSVVRDEKDSEKGRTQTP